MEKVYFIDMNFFIKLTVLFLVLPIGCSTTVKQSQVMKNAANPKEIVVLLHGLGRSSSAMWRLEENLEDAGFHVARLGYHSLNQSPEEILLDIGKQVDVCCAKYEYPVHFVGHSLGGLIIRAYLEKNKVKNLGRVVLMGTPNQGTEIVDKFRNKWWLKLLGPTALSLGTDNESFPKSLKAPYYPVGVIAGEYRYCENDNFLPGKDDGLVSVEGTKLEGMTDFIVVKNSHSSMRYNKVVANQVIAFLLNGKFALD